MDEEVPPVLVAAEGGADENDKPHKALTKSSLEGGPVTCVSLPSEEFLLFGRGPFLERHSAFFRKGDGGNDNHHEERHLLFPEGGTIHGIRYHRKSRSGLALVFGGRQIGFLENALQCDQAIRCLSVQHNEDSSSNSNKFSRSQTQLELSDWIWDIAFIDMEDVNNEKEEGELTTSCSLVVGLAHHILELWHVGYTSESSVQVVRQSRIVATPACLVTSMNLFPCPTSHELWVAAGTAFRDIVVWKTKLSASSALNQETNNVTIRNKEEEEEQQQQDSTSLVYLKAHAGVVHSVQFSSDGITLLSTSDDRTVRLWRKQQETDNPDETSSWVLAWTGWGHTARVWSAAFSPLMGVVVSAGEDHCIRVWSQDEGRELAILNSASASVWSMDSYNSLVIAGGNNGTVILDDLSSRLRLADSQGGRLRAETYLIPDDRVEVTSTDSAKANGEQPNNDLSEVVWDKEEATGQPKKKKKAKKPITQVIVGIKWYNFCSGRDPQLLVATRNGSLTSLDLQDQQWTQLGSWWDPLLLTSNGIKCTDGCCMAVHPDDNCVAIGTTRGDIVVVQDIHEGIRRIVLSSARDQKSVQGLAWVNRSTLLSFHIRTSTWWSFPDDPAIALEEGRVRGVTLSMGSKAVPMSFSHDSKNGNVLIGDSRGGIALFQRVNEKLGSEGPPRIVEPDGALHFVHQKEHVTGLQLHSNELLSVGNDGCLHISYIEGSTLRKGLSIPAGSLSGISDVWSIRRFKGGVSNTVVGGYHGNTFVVMDVASGYELFRADTGGRQRSKDFFIDISSVVQSSFTRRYGLAVCSSRKDGRNELILHHMPGCGDQETSGPRELQFSKGVTLHTETLFCLNLFSLRGQLILLTGSEDCSSRISLCRPGHSGGLIDSMALTPQESCVRAVCSSQRDDRSALVVVGGGKLVLQFFRVTEKREGCKLPATGLGGLEVSLLGYGRVNENAGIDHRINAVKAIPLNGHPGLHLVVAGDSNGNCHFYTVSENHMSRHVHGYLQPVGPRPILSVDIVTLPSRLLLIFGTTGGAIVLWDLPCNADDFPIKDGVLDRTGSLQGHPLGGYQAHQMGTNTISASIFTLREDDDGFNAIVLICSGGDDQAICTCETRISLRSSGLTKLEQPLSPNISREASSSAIKGIIQLPKGDDRTVTTFLSVGYSQRLAKWQYSSCEPQRLKLLNRYSVDVGDVNCLHASGGMVAVGGFGVELFSLLLDKK